MNLKVNDEVIFVSDHAELNTSFVQDEFYKVVRIFEDEQTAHLKDHKNSLHYTAISYIKEHCRKVENGMNKVKLTQEQAEAIEFLKINKYSIEGYKALKEDNESNPLSDNDRHYEKVRSLNSLTLDGIAIAFYVGYEVEPQFKEGDIVVSAYAEHDFNRNKIGKILEIDGNDCSLDRKMPLETHKFRHATDNEKIFYELGRKVGEFKEGDKYVTKTGSNRSVENSNNLKVVEGAYEQNNIKYFYPVESRKEFK